MASIDQFINKKKLNVSSQLIYENLRKAYARPVSRISFELMITAIAILGLSLAVIQPTMSSITRLIKDIDERKSTDIELTKKQASLATASETFETRKKELDILETVLPNAPQLIGLLKRIEKLATETGITLSNISVSDVAKDLPHNPNEGDIQQYALTFSIQGTYPQIQQLLTAFLTLDRFVKVTQVSISRPKDKDSSILSANLEMQFSYFGEASSKAKETQKKSGAAAKSAAPAAAPASGKSGKKDEMEGL